MVNHIYTLKNLRYQKNFNIENLGRLKVSLAIMKGHHSHVKKINKFYYLNLKLLNNSPRNEDLHFILMSRLDAMNMWIL